MAISLFWRGIIMGVAIAAPVGPIGILCIRQTLTYGLLTGLVSGLGAATADGLYGSISGFGLVAISDPLVSQKPLLTTSVPVQNWDWQALSTYFKFEKRI